MTVVSAPVATPSTAWTLTDPDAQQYGRQLAPGVYEFKEKRGRSEFQATVKLADYSPERRNYYCEAFYGSLADLLAQFPDPQDWEWLLAECIFEQL